MEVYKISNLSFTYPCRETKTLDGIDLVINQGEFVCICGKSGCGKTTLMRLLKSVLSPSGTVEGEIAFKGSPLSEADQRTQASKIGFVMQDIEGQLVCDKVWHELAFGLEGLGYSNSKIRTRVAETASFFGINEWFHKKTSELSGGQKQILNLASVMVMRPDVLILDEPASQLDPIAASEFLRTLEKINCELGTTIILSEHRLEEIFPVSDRVIVMDSGRIAAEGSPKAVGQILKEKNHDMQYALPCQIRVYGAIEENSDYPLTVREGRMWLESYAREHTIRPVPFYGTENSTADVMVELSELWFRYEKNSPDVLKGLSLKVRRGEIFAVLGGNGSGKTTMLSVISGLKRAYRGKVLIKGENISDIENLYEGVMGVLPQNPQSLFVKKTVELELAEMLTEDNPSKEEREGKIREAASLCRIEHILSCHPYDLSGGEQQRAALAKVLLKNPEILLLDEPTKGFDAHFKIAFAEILQGLKAKGVTVIMVSHDIEFCAEYADRCAMFFDGGITADAQPREFFAGNSFYTTSANRMAGNILPEAVLAEDIICACGGKAEEKHTEAREDACALITKTEPAVRMPQKKIKTDKTARFSVWFSLIAVLLTVFAGIYYLEDRQYYLISLLIIPEVTVPFCLAFEKRKPNAREMVLVSVMCALVVAGRMAFFMFYQFKPVAALIIITGVCLGGETGFLVGAVSAFVSNFFFGQGPWTPWHMFVFGMLGLVSGVVFRKGRLPVNRISLCVFGFLAIIIIYGGIMNPASVIMMQMELNRETVLAAYVQGFPLDLIHAAATVFFLWFTAEPMLEKLERIKEKYGILK